jgi:hypothetical protein
MRHIVTANDREAARHIWFKGLTLLNLPWVAKSRVRTLLAYFWLEFGATLVIKT